MASASSSCEESSSSYIDSFGSQCLSVLRVLGLPSTVVLIRVSPFLFACFGCFSEENFRLHELETLKVFYPVLLGST